MKQPTLKYFLIHAVGLLVCVVPPIIATLEYFPLWFSQTETAVSVLSAMVIAVCCLPFFKQIKAYFNGSPASWAFFAVMWLVTMSLNKLIDGVETISFIGMLSNLAGGFIFRVEKHIKAREGVKSE